MIMNKDNFQTPAQALIPLLKTIPQSWVVWEPFAGQQSLVNAMREQGYTVIASDITQGEDFFETDRECDIVISNPPYSCSEEVIARLYELKKPFALLLPITHLGGKRRQQMYRENGGVSVIMLGGRLNFLTPTGKFGKDSNAQFESVWVLGGAWGDSGMPPFGKISFQTLPSYHWEGVQESC